MRPLRKQDRDVSKRSRNFDTDASQGETSIVNNRDIAQEEWLMLQLAELPVVVRHLFLGMRQAGFNDSLTRELLTRFTDVSEMGEPLTLASGWSLLRSMLAKKLRVLSNNPLNATHYRVMLLGPTGGGKSTVVQKIANRVPTRERATFTAISVVLDDQDVRRQPERLALVRGVNQHLHLFGHPLSTTLRQAELHQRVMIDVTGTCADTDRRRRLLQRTLIGTEDFVKVLVMPVNLHPFDLTEQLRRYDEIGYDQLVLTKSGSRSMSSRYRQYRFSFRSPHFPGQRRTRRGQASASGQPGRSVGFSVQKPARAVGREILSWLQSFHSAVEKAGWGKRCC